jgi:ubiquinone/menaquinone biosynthesis C-methylase UbiE
VLLGRSYPPRFLREDEPRWRAIPSTPPEMPNGLLHLYRRLVRRIFHHFYHEFAWTYDGVAWVVSAGLWVRWALVALPRLRGRILELGFGPGHLQLALAPRPSVAGLDASPQMSGITARRLRRAGYQPRLACGIAQALPFASAAFDTVVATFPAEYILDPRTHAEIRRVLAPHGRLIVVPWAQLNPGPYAHIADLAYRLALRSAPRRRDVHLEPEATRLQLNGLELDVAWVAVGASRVALLEGELNEDTR